MQEGLNLANFLVEQYGIAANTARDLIRMADITIDGEPLQGNPFALPLSYLHGKAVYIKGDVRSFMFTVPRSETIDAYEAEKAAAVSTDDLPPAA